jgi:hypothetical protein
MRCDGSAWVATSALTAAHPRFDPWLEAVLEVCGERVWARH